LRKGCPTARPAFAFAGNFWFFINDHYRGYPTVLVRLASVTRTELQGVLEQAWGLHAPRRLVSEYEQRRKH
jgi:hypothetical protein